MDLKRISERIDSPFGLSHISCRSSHAAHETAFACASLSRQRLCRLYDLHTIGPFHFTASSPKSYHRSHAHRDPRYVYESSILQPLEQPRFCSHARRSRYLLHVEAIFHRAWQSDHECRLWCHVRAFLGHAFHLTPDGGRRNVLLPSRSTYRSVDQRRTRLRQRPSEDAKSVTRQRWLQRSQRRECHLRHGVWTAIASRNASCKTT